MSFLVTSCKVCTTIKQKNCRKKTFFIPIEHVSVVRTMVNFKKSPELVLPDNLYNFDGFGKALTYLDDMESAFKFGLPSHCLIGFIRPESQQRNLSLNPDHYVLNTMFKLYFYECWKEHIKKYYHLYTSNLIDFNKDDFIECVVIDGRAQEMMFDLLQKQFEGDTIEIFQEHGAAFLNEWFEKYENEENIVATFHINHKNEFMENTYLKGGRHRILSQRGWGFSRIPNELLKDLQNKTYAAN
eukprot:481734_1